ncbi:threonine/serine dehydratase [Piscinibacter sp.]|jgi:threonine dehydratase|uniref:threonine ammonia-lyase n=1 Tax=Piscinibacter sp. TaxID=1903157 RepID=UPI00355A90B7
MINVTLQDVLIAQKRIAGSITQTPLVYSDKMSELRGADVWMKMESLQRTGSFKLRGATNRLLALTPAERTRGVVTASSGNFALGLGTAARLAHVSAIVVVPTTAPETKLESIRRLGVQLVIEGANYDAAYAHAKTLALKTGRTYVSSYEDPWVVAGQATAALEAFMAEPHFDLILVPTGGGGLLSGVSMIAKSINPGIKVIGLQTEASDPWVHSFRERRVVQVEYGETLADGLLGEVGAANLDMVLRYVDDFLVVKESEVAEAMHWMVKYHHQIVEGSAAVGVAALLHHLPDIGGLKILNIVTGSNVDSKRIAPILHAYE